MSTQKDKLVISGPCSAESREQVLLCAQQLAANGRVDVYRAGVWKPRTKPGCFEGIGEPALKWMQEARALTGIPIATEVARASHVEAALAHGVDVLWIGARTSGDPFAVQEVAEALRGVSQQKIFVKNPMNPDLSLWMGAVERMERMGLKNLGLIHRGFSTYSLSDLRNSPMWHIAAQARRLRPELPLICDPSHISGARKYVQEIAQMAADLNFDGLMVETHPNPEVALSDADQQLTPTQLSELLDKIKWHSETTENHDYLTTLETLRAKIDELDTIVFDLLSQRMKISREIGELKSGNNVAIVQRERWADITEYFVTRSRDLELGSEFVEQVLDAIQRESISQQHNDKSKK